MNLDNSIDQENHRNQTIWATEQETRGGDSSPSALPSCYPEFPSIASARTKDDRAI